MATPSPAVFVLDAGYVVVELPEDASAPSLALELHFRRGDEDAWAFWLFADGTFVCPTPVGEA